MPAWLENTVITDIDLAETTGLVRRWWWGDPRPSVLDRKPRLFPLELSCLTGGALTDLGAEVPPLESADDPVPAALDG